MPKTLDGERNLWWQVLARVRVDSELEDEVGVDSVGGVLGIDTELSTGEDDGLC